MNTSAKKQIIPELLAAVLWGILTLWTDRLFFRYDWRTTAFFVYKALFVLLAFLLVHGIVTLVKKLRAKDRFVWRWRWCRSCAPGTNLPGGGWPGRCRIWR